MLEMLLNRGKSKIEHLLERRDSDYSQKLQLESDQILDQARQKMRRFAYFSENITPFAVVLPILAAFASVYNPSPVDSRAWVYIEFASALTGLTLRGLNRRRLAILDDESERRNSIKPLVDVF